jgi:phosphodiesterase/alkaline phosphatase D-like protein
VYADELTPEARRHLAGRRSVGRRPPDEVVSFTEYEGLYGHTWGDPEIRWILSTLPTAMIFDDHDIRDDWNTSAVWRREVNEKPWWRDRIRAGLASYWVYQHLGNLSPAELRDDPDYRKVLAADGDSWPHLAELADRADAEVDGDKGLRFSYRWDLGRSRLVMIDSRNARILDGGARKMVGDREFDWLADQVFDGLDRLDHLVLGSSLPWLLPPMIGDLQTVNEIAAARPGWRGRLGEKVRQAADFEHWAAFADSFLRLTGLIADAASRPGGPATISVLSGDVHHSYAARANLPGPTDTRVHQLVCSPVHNYVPSYVKPVFRLGWSQRLARLSRRYARRQGSPALPISWRNSSGPLFGNTIATLTTTGRTAEVLFEQPRDTGELRDAVRVPLTD